MECDKDTVCHWLPRVGRHCCRVLEYFFRDLHLTECQLDELWTFVYKKEKHLTMLEKLAGRYGDAWIWTAFDPIHKLVLAWRVGKRTLGDARKFVKSLKSKHDSHLPFFTSDDLPHYADALLEMYGETYTPPRKGLRGRLPLPRKRPPAELCYAVVIKEREGSRVVRVTTRLVYGTEEQLHRLLKTSPVSTTINTYGVERNRLRRHRAPAFTSVGTQGECLLQEACVPQAPTRVSVRLLSLLLSAPRPTPKTQLSNPNQEGQRLTQEMASRVPRDGRWSHRPCLDDG